MDNASLADRLESLAGLLALADASPFSVRAFRRAAEVVRSSPVDVAALVRAGRARELRGIGPGVEARLREPVETGQLAELEELRRSVRPELLGLAQQLGLDRARGLCERVAAWVGGTVAGDVRRGCDECRALTVVAAGDDAGSVVARFRSSPDVLSIDESARGAVGATIEGIGVELVVAPPDRLGTALVEATGAAPYVDALGPLPRAPTEALVYERLGVPWCPPELREGPFRGEPPALVTLPDVRGDLHVHTTWSDGRASVLEMAEAAKSLGYEYLAICDHTPSVGVVPGLTADDLRRQAVEIAEANERVAPLRVLRGVECDIRPDGTLDLPDDVLAELEWVQLSLHAGQRAPAAEITRRVTEAMRHPAVRCLSHPTGRIVNHRPPNALDLDRVVEVALETGVALEVNGLPDRLDLNGPRVRLAVEAGVPIVVSTDAHSIRGLGNMALAVTTARRGWATVGHVLNTSPLAGLR